MLFTEKTPSNVLNNPNAAAYLSILDKLQQYKSGLIQQGNTFYRPPLLTNLQFLRQLVQEFGWPQVPADFPKQILDNMYLNAQNVFALKGSKIGLNYWLRVLTCGLPSIDDSQFYPEYDYIVLDDLVYGYLFADSMLPDNILYLWGGEDAVTEQILTIGVETPYYNLVSLQQYINDNIHYFIGFTDANSAINITLTDGPYVPNPYANQYFVIGGTLDELL